MRVFSSHSPVGFSGTKPYQSRLLADYSRKKVQSISRNVVEEVRSDQIIPLAANEADARVPHNVASRFIHPLFEPNVAEFSPA